MTLIRLTASPSPITTEVVALSGVSFSDLKQYGEDGVAFACRDPSNAGKSCVKTLTLGSSEPVLRTPLTANVRSAVHEYGGAPYCVGPNGEGIIYTDFPTHVVYWAKTTDEDPIQIYPPEGTSPFRFADFSVIRDDEPLAVAILEDHTDPAPSKVQNSIVTLSLDGKGTLTTLASGHDFYACPQFNRNSNTLAFLAWDHPNMPWDSTTLYLLELNDQFEPHGEPVAVHGQEGDISVQEPRWWNDKLLFLSNVSGWYNLYSWTKDSATTTPLFPKEADFSDSHQGWMLGLSPFATFQDGRVVASYDPISNDDDADSGTRIVLLAVQDDGGVSNSQEIGRKHLPPTDISLLCPTASGAALYFCGGSAAEPSAIWCWENLGDNASIAKPVLSSMNDYDRLKPILEPFMSLPRKIRFPSTDGIGYAYGYYYPPTNLSDDTKSNQTLPPLLVKAHGGPTARTSASFRLSLQFWTSRGFAVLDVDYGGSTGYGKEYLQSLRGKWGIVDVADVCSGAKYCVDQGWVNNKWLCIDGSSAGGYTTLAALTFKDVMAAGASLYGISDLSALAADTHKFESRYMDGLVGPYPEQKAIYDERCPLNFTDKLNCPILLLQGDEDQIVPPNQAVLMFDALLAKGIPSTLVMYKGEQHGFRKASNIRHVLNSEYNFFCQVFGLEPQVEEGFDCIRMGERFDIS